MLDPEERPECCGKPMHSRGHKAESGRHRWRCSECGTSTTGSGDAEPTHHENLDPAVLDARYNYLRSIIKKKGPKKFVITCAQNNTEPHTKFFNSLLKYCKHNSAELIVVPVSYKNISLFTANQEYKKRWHESIAPYLLDRRLPIGGNTVVQGGIHIQATASNPLSGLNAIEGNQWTIYGHPQFAMEPVACPSHRIPKRMYTTGSLTVKNYSETKMGAKADFHHVMGALVVEIVNNRKPPFIRQLNADSQGRFYDLTKLYTPEKIYKGLGPLALVTGDEHELHMLRSVRKATFTEPDSILNTLRPKFIVRHDILDCYFGSHHHEKDYITQFLKHHKGIHDGRKELDRVVKHINETTPKWATNLIVPSNHHDHLYKWLNRVDPNKDPTNALLVHELRQAQYESGLKGGTVDPLELYLVPRLNCKYKFLDRQAPHFIAGIDVSQHGDVGTNGSRGSARGLAKSSNKMMIGHGHGARIVNGVYQVGTSTGQLEYESGMSDHTNTHGLIYPNGKRTLIDIFYGKWCG